MIMANRVFSVAAVMLGASALMSSLAVTPAAAWTYHRHVRVYRYAPAHYVTVHPVYRDGYHAAYNYYGYRPAALAGGVVDAASAMAVDFITGPAAEALFPGEAAGFEATPALNTFAPSDSGPVLLRCIKLSSRSQDRSSKAAMGRLGLFTKPSEKSRYLRNPVVQHSVHSKLRTTVVAP